MKNVLFVIFIIIETAFAQEKFKICATETITDTTCSALQRSRGESRVSCIRVTDSAECAIKMAEEKADFGIFNAEEMLLAYQFYQDDIVPIVQLKHPDRINEEFEFQSVAVVPATFDSKNGLAGLKNGGFCHPGFSETQIWNDNILKHFEKKVYDMWCRSDLTASENEAENLKNFFGRSCRPGEWVPYAPVDEKLKKSNPELCELCDDALRCQYKNTTHHGHFGALDCLVKGRGQVAYVAYEYVRQYFALNTSSEPTPLAVPIGFRFLCPDGSTLPLTSKYPCAWLKQPWSALLARKKISDELLSGLKIWLNPRTEKVQDWTVALNSIIQANAKAIYFSKETNLKSYLMSGRELELASNTCGKSIRWCTVNVPEHNKCIWLAKEALALGIEPSFSCVIANSTFDCLRDIADGKADIITIDSNYGYIARHVFNLTTAMYTETDSDKNSQVLALLREDGSNKITSFNDLKKGTACFPEYGGIAWLSFLNTIREKKIISNSCDYPKLVAQLLSGACTPGIGDADHSVDSTDANAASVLCSLCPAERTNATCSANQDNFYYGDKGALECLKSKAGDVAFVESKNLMDHINAKHINPDDYRVLCKNGSLASYTGFDVDQNCALSVTIDSEVVGRKDNSETFTKDAMLALLKIEDWLGYRVDYVRPIRIYDSFSGNADLLFKDSTVGLVPPSSQIKTVLAYKELFSHLESCNGVVPLFANSFTIFLILSITHYFFN